MMERRAFYFWLMIMAFVAACVPQKPRSFPEAASDEAYEGTDIRAQFLRKYAGEYDLPESGGLKGIEAAKSHLSLLSDGSYVMTVGTQRISKGGDKRTAICAVEERGVLSHVQKFAKTKEPVQVGRDRIGNFDPVGGFVVLEPKESRITFQQTVVYDERRQMEVRVDKADAYAEKDFRWFCTRTSPRVLYVEDFLDGALLLARSQSRGGTALRDRLAVKNGLEWLWFTGPLAVEAVNEVGLATHRGIQSLEIFGSAAPPLSRMPKAMALGLDTQFDKDGRLWLNIGARVGEAVLPVMSISGRLEGVSYSPSTEHVVVQLSDFASQSAASPLGPTDLAGVMEGRLNYAWRLMQVASEKINAYPERSNVFLTADLSAGDPDVVRISAKNKF
jgi:hypothetical protein